jgi:hypothetical protein
MKKIIIGILVYLFLFISILQPIQGSLLSTHESRDNPSETVQVFLKLDTFKKHSVASSQEPWLLPIPGKQESVSPCSVSSNGSGSLIPMFLFPRPRLVTLWVAYSGTTFAINPKTLKGFNASGYHIGLAVGFIGVGFTYRSSKVSHYVVVGRALKVKLYGENVSAYPPQ